jgi:hypothetical protein
MANHEKLQSQCHIRLPFTVYQTLCAVLYALCALRFALCVSVDIALAVPKGYIRRAHTFFA